MQRYTSEEKINRIKDWKKSGKSIGQYCYELGYDKSTMYNWRKQYIEQTQGSASKFIEIRATTESIMPEVKLRYPNGVILEIYRHIEELDLKTLIGC